MYTVTGGYEKGCYHSNRNWEGFILSAAPGRSYQRHVGASSVKMWT